MGGPSESVVCTVWIQLGGKALASGRRVSTCSLSEQFGEKQLRL